MKRPACAGTQTSLSWLAVAGLQPRHDASLDTRTGWLNPSDWGAGLISTRLCLGVALGILAQMAAADAFTDISTASGLAFDHDNGAQGRLLFPEITGQGAALCDLDNDGDLDAWLVQGGPLDGTTDRPSDQLFRNDLKDGVPTFVNVTTAAGVTATGYGMGVACGDIDNDGDVDVFVANYGPNQLWINEGGLRFSEQAAAWGVAHPGWGTSASFADLDGDGWLDLYVANYVDYDHVEAPRCFAESTRQDYCGPAAFEPQQDRLYRNAEGKSFADVTSAWIHDAPPGAGLGVVAADFDRDGKLDLYVANDGAPNHLLLNQGDGKLVNDAWFRGVAVNSSGRPEASMGIAAGDFDNDGDTDLFLTHLMSESSTFYVNTGGAVFEDQTQRLGLADSSRRYTGWGTRFFDFDNDGWQDLVSFNGAVRINEAQAAAGIAYPLRQRNQLYRSQAGQRFVEVDDAGAGFSEQEVSRGAAFGDVDNDGDPDILMVNSLGPARLLRNDVGASRHWVGLSVLDGQRHAIGATVEVTHPAGVTLYQVARDGSFASSSDPRILVGLGRAAVDVKVVVTQRNGERTEHTLSPDRYHVIGGDDR